MIEKIGLSVLLVSVVFCVYANAIYHPFVHDDIVFIQQNPNISSIDLQSIFLTHSPHNIEGINAYYRPFLELIYRLEYKLFGFDASGYHFVNIAWHALNSLLVFAIVSSLGVSIFFAFAVGLFFGVHPVQSEAVACVAGISNIAVTFFVLCAWYCYVQRWIILAVLFFICGLFSKETAFVFIPLAILTDWLFRRKEWMLWGFLIVIGFEFLGWRQILTQSHLIDDILSSPNELYLRIMHIPSAILTYLKSVVWPADLHYYRNLDVLSAWWPSWLILAGVCALLRFLSPNDYYQRRLYWFGFIFFIVALLPILNIVPLVNEYSFILTADHFVYLPLIGLLISFGCCIQQWLLPPRRVVIVVVTALLAIFLTIYQNTFWQSEIAVFERTVLFEPKFGRGHVLLAKAYFFKQRYAKAVEHYDKATSIFENYLHQVQDPKAQIFYKGFLKGIHFDCAQAYLSQNKLQSAQEEYIRAIHFDPFDEVLYNNLASVLMVKQNWIQAKEILLKSLELNPTHLMALNNLAICLIQTGSPQEAKSIWQKILTIDPKFTPALQNLKVNPQTGSAEI